MQPTVRLHKSRPGTRVVERQLDGSHGCKLAHSSPKIIFDSWVFNDDSSMFNHINSNNTYIIQEEKIINFTLTFQQKYHRPYNTLFKDADNTDSVNH